MLNFYMIKVNRLKLEVPGLPVLIALRISRASGSQNIGKVGSHCLQFKHQRTYSFICRLNYEVFLLTSWLAFRSYYGNGHYN